MHKGSIFHVEDFLVEVGQDDVDDNVVEELAFLQRSDKNTEKRIIAFMG